MRTLKYKRFSQIIVTGICLALFCMSSPVLAKTKNPKYEQPKKSSHNYSAAQTEKNAITVADISAVPAQLTTLPATSTTLTITGASQPAGSDSGATQTSQDQTPDSTAQAAVNPTPTPTGLSMPQIITTQSLLSDPNTSVVAADPPMPTPAPPWNLSLPCPSLPPGPLLKTPNWPLIFPCPKLLPKQSSRPQHKMFLYRS